ncbi:Arc family DNA-binding protein [Pseudomonas aeruginosa]
MTTKAKTKKQGTALILRTCSADLTSHGGFQWPDKIGAVVEAPDWKKDNKCGHGLHGWLFGQGDHGCSSTVGDADAKWLVVEVGLSDLIALGGKVKFPRCTIRHIGDKASATQFLIANEPRAAGVAVIGATLQAGDKELCQVGAYGTATAGYKGTATAGDWGTATAGNEGTATAGNEGTATAGYKGTATAGYKGTATAGYKGTATAGYKGTATAGKKGEIQIRYWDEKTERYRTVIGYIGEDGLEPGVAYKLDDNHRFVKAGGLIMKRATVVTELPASTSRDMDKFVVRLPDGLRAEVEAEARRDERSMNSVVIIALREYLHGQRRKQALLDALTAATGGH